MADLGLYQTVRLAPTLSPQMRQSLALLQAPALELRTMIAQELTANPVLEESQDGEAEAQDDLELFVEREEEWGDYFAQLRGNSSYDSEAAEKRRHFFESQSEELTLGQHLESQLILATQDEELRRAAREIIGNLDEDGYLRATLEEVSFGSGVSLPKVEQALRVVQFLDPVGVGARDLKECLLLQLERLGKREDIEGKIVARYLEELGKKRWTLIARGLRVPLERVRQAANCIASLDPRPGSRFSREEKFRVIEADLLAEKVDGQWVAVPNDSTVPRLRISETYKDLLASPNADPATRQYLREKIRAGRFLIKCLLLREQTLLNVANAILKHQQEFFEKGGSALRPLTMNQIAQEVGIHETTVSRAIANKYIQTPWGMYELKYFFSPGYQASNGAVVSNRYIKEAIAEMIAREDPKNPLSDQDLVERLAKRGISLARRTVAKYRASLDILPSHLRKGGS
jgi:RNA polymerase sigma-54 factor